MTFTTFAKKRISVSAFVFGVTLIVLLSQLLRLLPHELYFTFSGFVFCGDIINSVPNAGSNENSTQSVTEEEAQSVTEEEAQSKTSESQEKPQNWLSIVFKMAIPAIAGILLGLIWNEEGVEVAVFVGLGSAFILAWPAMVLWDFVVLPGVVLKRNAFLILYLLYALTYAYTCQLLSYVGLQIRSSLRTSGSTAVTSLSWKAILESALASLVTAGLTWIWTHAFLS